MRELMPRNILIGFLVHRNISFCIKSLGTVLLRNLCYTVLVVFFLPRLAHAKEPALHGKFIPPDGQVLLIIGIVVGVSSPVLSQPADLPQVEQQVNISPPQELFKQALTARETGHDLLQARALLEQLLKTYPDFEQRVAVQQERESVNVEIILSDIPLPQTIHYQVQKGDTLGKIAGAFSTTPDLIMRRNHLKNDLIRQGQWLSIWRAPFAILIDKSDNKLTLKCGDWLIRVYPVSTGRESKTTPVGEFAIKNRLVNPVWFHHGVVVPPGTPQNFLGTRWLGFDRPGYGIHGTVEPQFIGQSVSSGCVRMLNRDVEELFTLIPIGTKVMIEE